MDKTKIPHANLYNGQSSVLQLFKNIKNTPVLGLINLLEVTNDTQIICCICSKLLNATTIVKHVQTLPHINAYVGKYLPEIQSVFPDIKKSNHPNFKEYIQRLLKFEAEHGRGEVAFCEESKKSRCISLLKNLTEKDHFSLLEYFNENSSSTPESEEEILNDENIPWFNEIKEKISINNNPYTFKKLNVDFSGVYSGKQISDTRLRTLFSIFGDIKIYDKSEFKLLIEYELPISAQLALEYANDISFDGVHLKVEVVEPNKITCARYHPYNFGHYFSLTLTGMKDGYKKIDVKKLFSPVCNLESDDIIMEERKVYIYFESYKTANQALYSLKLENSGMKLEWSDTSQSPFPNDTLNEDIFDMHLKIPNEIEAFHFKDNYLSKMKNFVRIQKSQFKVESEEEAIYVIRFKGGDKKQITDELLNMKSNLNIDMGPGYGISIYNVPTYLKNLKNMFAQVAQLHGGYGRGNFCQNTSTNSLGIACTNENIQNGLYVLLREFNYPDGNPLDMKLWRSGSNSFCLSNVPSNQSYMDLFRYLSKFGSLVNMAYYPMESKLYGTYFNLDAKNRLFKAIISKSSIFTCVAIHMNEKNALFKLFEYKFVLILNNIPTGISSVEARLELIKYARVNNVFKLPRSSIAYLFFTHKDDAQDAFEKLNKIYWGNKQITAEFYPSCYDVKSSVSVTNVMWGGEEELIHIMSQCGTIQNVYCHAEDLGRFEILFSTQHAAKKAVDKYNKHRIKGRKISIKDNSISNVLLQNISSNKKLKLEIEKVFNVILASNLKCPEMHEKYEKEKSIFKKLYISKQNKRGLNEEDFMNEFIPYFKKRIVYFHQRDLNDEIKDRLEKDANSTLDFKNYNCKTVDINEIPFPWFLLAAKRMEDEFKNYFS